NQTGATANLFTIRPDGSGRTQITHLSGDGFYAGKGAWSPDGTQIVYHKLAPGGINDLFLINADGTNERQLTHLGNDVNPSAVDGGTTGIGGGGAPEARGTDGGGGGPGGRPRLR